MTTRTSLFSVLLLSAGLLGGTAAIAQEATAQVHAQTNTRPAQPGRDHKALTAEQIKDIGPAYQRLKDAGYTKVGSIRQRNDKVIATVVDKEGNVVRVQGDADNGAFTPWEPKKEGRHHRRGHTESKTDVQNATTSDKVSS
ncbi:MAG TPA: hypothetical protein PLG97_13135 [Alcaligenes sp.]|nr:hypothetical protein [Alcaligenes sp.]HRL28460.1 hypothetical protein [Alcaligenes sp.]